MKSDRCHPCQLPPEQRHIHLVEVKYCEDLLETRPSNQLEAFRQQHRDLCRHLSRASAQVTLHTGLLGVGVVTCTPQTTEPLYKLLIKSSILTLRQPSSLL
eukprot:694237-Pelagomonas_calceolata.AAC.2